jgi:hypothetical protein
MSLNMETNQDKGRKLCKALVGKSEQGLWLKENFGRQMRMWN